MFNTQCTKNYYIYVDIYLNRWIGWVQEKEERLVVSHQLELNPSVVLDHVGQRLQRHLPVLGVVRWEYGLGRHGLGFIADELEKIDCKGFRIFKRKGWVQIVDSKLNSKLLFKNVSLGFFCVEKLIFGFSYITNPHPPPTPANICLPLYHVKIE